MKLSILERLLLLNALPSVVPDHSRLTIFRMFRKLQDDLSFTQEEHEAFGLKQDPKEPSRILWTHSEDVEIDIPDLIREKLSSYFADLDEKEKLPKQFVPIAERLITGESHTEQEQ